MCDKTYMAQRIICDYFNSIEEVLNISVEKGMLLSVAGARQKYMQYLDDKKRIKSDQEKGEKRKSLLNEIEELKYEKKRIENDTKTLETEADQLALKAYQDL